MSSVKVVHAACDGMFNIAGASVGNVRATLVDAFNIPVDAHSLVNGVEVEQSYCLQTNDTLEFIRRWGRKGGSPPKWMSLAEAAAYLGIGAKALKSLCIKREVTFLRFGNRGRSRTGEFRFQQAWLDEFVERSTIKATEKIVRPPRRQSHPLVTEVFIDPRKCGNPFGDN